jgi:hypothetical protein
MRIYASEKYIEILVCDAGVNYILPAGSLKFWNNVRLSNPCHNFCILQSEYLIVPISTTGW